jgi:hypothetical protein
MSDELKERNILKLILIVRFACVTLDVGHPIHPLRLGYDVKGVLHLKCHFQAHPSQLDKFPLFPREVSRKSKIVFFDRLF